MDSPERNQIGTPVSKFEDSPVFNYISNLSPIKPVKSLHIAQTFHSLSFASVPSVFTSPHVSSQKESKFLGRHHFSDFSKPDFSSDDIGDGSKASIGNSGNDKFSDYCSAGEQESCHIGISIEEFNVDRHNERSKISVRLPQALQYVGSLDCGNPTNDTTCFAIKMEMAEGPASLVKLSQGSAKESVGTIEMQGRCELQKTKDEGSCCDWENLISDAADVLIFNSSTESETCRGEGHKMVNLEATSFALVSHLPQDKVDDLHSTQTVGSLQDGHQQQNPINRFEEVRDGKQKEADHTPQLLPSVYQNKQDTKDQDGKMDDEVGDSISLGNKVDTLQQRGLRRRCLVFEVSAHKKKMETDSKSDSSISMDPEGKCASDDKKLVPFKPRICSSPCMLPGIGLHLNTLASTSKDFRIVKHETLTSGSRLISMPASVGSFHCLTARQNSMDQSLAPNNAQGDLISNGNEIQVIQEDLQEAALETGEEFNQNSPKKKRRKLENAGESEACKRCNCKKSKCLKLYCECFAAGVYCVEPCSCHDCFNKPVHEDTVLATRKQIESRNPLAFAPKVIRNSETAPETGEEANSTPASARHKRGCNCKKSSCLKKYCECYQGGVGCSSNCRCEGCKNAFGRKSGGYAQAGTEETEPEDEVSQVGEKDRLDKCQQINEVHKDEQLLEAVLPMTPYQIFRKPPRPSLLSGGSSSSLNARQLLRKPDFMQPQSFEKHFQINPEDETPEILRGHCSPVSGVKATSPNKKRVSPPNRDFGLSPGQRSTPTRKLILQSIPSFPSLTPYHRTNGI